MGLITTLLGVSRAASDIGGAATDLAEVFTPNATQKMRLDSRTQAAALGQFGQEFGLVRPGPFDRMIDGLNRVPRPALAIGTLGLFVYAMVDPIQFSVRMQGLERVPAPLWWLLGAIVSFYFGARELQYARSARAAGAITGAMNAGVSSAVSALVQGGGVPGAAANAALREWQERSEMK